MAAPAILKIDIVADATKALKALGDTGDKAEGAFSKISKVVGPALATTAVVGFGKASVTAAQESAVATARLDQIFSSMGDTTGQASKAAQDYAAAMSAKIGVDDDAIMAGQAQLATFGSVSSETARLAGVFDRATAAGADLAAAGFGSIDSNAVQLGKALEDPTKGMTALAKSGVTFTDAQKDQIKAMQESGDLLGAQNIVLAAVEKQVGGTAEATATSSGKMAVAFGEVQEELGGKLLPVVSTLADVLARYSGLIIPIGAAILGVVAAVKLWNIYSAIQAAVTTEGSVAQAIFNAVMAANPIILVVLAIAALIGALVLAYFKIGWFRDFVDAAFDAVVAAFNLVKDAAVAVFRWVADNWPLLLAILTGPIGIAVLLITKNWDTLKDAAKAMVQWVMDRFQDLTGFVSRIAEAIGGVMRSIGDAIRLPIDAATAMVEWVIGKFQALLDFIRDLVGKVGGVVGDIVGALKGPINGFIRLWNGLEFTIPKVEVLGQTLFPGATIGLPDVPTLQRGGRVLRTGMALVHEGETFSGVGGSSGGTVINLTVTHSGLGVDSPQLQRDIVGALRGYVGRNGPLGAPIVASG
jgi:hypothetical protein